jgi:LPXTG-motif cell wall-anchored protein
VKKFFAVAMTAALVLPAVATSAAAQDETITVEGVVFFDRNENSAFDPGENVRATAPGVRVINVATQEQVADVAAENGRYRVVLPKGPRYQVAVKPVVGFAMPYIGKPFDGDTTVDFPLWGNVISGFSFVDANGDGVKQADEKTHDGRVVVTGEAGTEPREQIRVETAVAADGSYSFELPLGDYTVTAPDLKKQRLALAKPLRAYDIDWVTGQGRANGEGRQQRLDLRYFEPKADAALEDVVISPAKDAYTVGEQIDFRFKLVNKGDVPGTMSVVLFQLAETDVKVISRSDNVIGRTESFETVRKVLPGEAITVEMKLEFANTELGELYAFVRPSVGGFADIDTKNQGQDFRKVIKVVEKGAETTAPSASPTQATAAPTTTTTPVVAQAGTRSGLASTGASVLGLLALGGVLLAGGLGAFFVARRRRS